MSKEDIPVPEKVLELSPGMSIWKVHLDSLRERDINARVMEDEKFRRLTENIKAEGDLESLPLVTPVPGRPEFYVISGHHRTRAARTAGVMVIHVISIDRELTEDEITSKQLAHNSLAGYDDPDVLAELYNSIRDLDAKLATGLTELEVRMEAPQVPASQIEVEFSYEPVYILFLSKQSRVFYEMLDRLEADVPILAADKDDFKDYVKMITAVTKREGIRNIAGIMQCIVKIVNEHYGVKK